MKKILKILGILVLIIVFSLTALRLFLHENEPVSTPSNDADIMTEKMLTAINKEAWDTTKVITWNFFGVHQYVWDKTRHFAQVKWDDTEVLLDINNITGKVYENGVKVKGEKAKNTLKTAWDYFNNDSFWLNAPAKAFDPGTVRSIVELEDGRKGLKVQYTSGGTTPGDSYVWLLDENNLPSSYKMWVQIIPIGGLEVSWEDYKTIYSGAKIAQLHSGKGIEMRITDINAAENFEGLGLAGDPFAAIHQ